MISSNDNTSKSGTDFEKERSVSSDNTSMSDFEFDGEKQEAASHRDISNKLNLAKIGFVVM